MKKFIRIITVAGVAVLVILSSFALALAQDEAPPEMLTVTKGVVELESVKYSVFTKITQVEKGGFGGIKYIIKESSEKAAVAKAKKVMTFYKNKKINGVKVPAFKKTSKPDTTAWVALKCGKGVDGIQVIIVIDGYDVVIYVIPACLEDVQAFVL